MISSLHMSVILPLITLLSNVPDVQQAAVNPTEGISFMPSDRYAYV